MNTTNPYAPPAAVVTDVAPSGSQDTSTPFFAVSVTKLLVLSICTLGLYQMYWFYKNWRLIRDRELSNIYPAPRAVFGIFYCYQCFKRIRDYEMQVLGKSSLTAGPLATGWIVLSLLHKLPDPYWLITFFAVVFTVPVQLSVNRINAAINPNHDANSRFSVWNWIAVAIGSIFFVLAVIGTLMPDS